ncbi:DsbA family oxidoreductase [Schaalia suimastitidis]|uniref:DsbA family oxidoreductase n=1 Tax=Schaalia suimastitidis TaxID=121163 RepID=UPI00042A61B7|nr:DsbA family protein [Schaalia suimastitidis]
MLVEIWIDLGCPWSYLTLRHLRRALGASPHAMEITVTIRPFFLEPDQDSTHDMPWLQRLIETDDLEPHAALEIRDRLIKLGQAEGVVFDLDQMILAPSARAFRAIIEARSIDWANDTTRGPDSTTLKLTEALMRARCEMALDISHPDVIVGCAQDIGIDAHDVVAALMDPQRGDDVWSEYQLAAHMGMNAVPTMLIEHQLLVQGMQTYTAMVNIITNAWEHVHRQ